VQQAGTGRGGQGDSTSDGVRALRPENPCGCAGRPLAPAVVGGSAAVRRPARMRPVYPRCAMKMGYDTSDRLDCPSLGRARPATQLLRPVAAAADAATGARALIYEQGGWAWAGKLCRSRETDSRGT
jgi:hypothetical protein